MANTATGRLWTTARQQASVRVCHDDEVGAGEPYRQATCGVRWHIAAVVGLGLGVGIVACGDGSDGPAAPIETSAAETTADTGLPPCRDVDRTVVFSVFGAATAGSADDAATWVDDPDAEPTARPNAAALATTYRESGHQLLYVAMLPSETRIGGRPVVDAITVWLGVNGFPVGEGVRVWVPEGDGSADASVALIEELARMGAAGTEIEAGYAGDQETVFPLVTGGVPRDRVYAVGDWAGLETSNTHVSSTPLPGEDLAAHVAEVEALDPICR